ncbi:hypothetical protein G3479_03445 [Shewanella baltica]|nr:hypothetical protein [Shewanella baltica]MCS6269122.1 hypothetical protein [Shewanella baltica]
MDGIHTTLDTGGLVPALGIIPDGINAVLYLFEGDMVNAGLSVAAMIPIAGQGVTVGKYGVKAADKLESAAKGVDDLAAARKEVATVAKSKAMKHKVACFKKNSKGSDIEYDRQLQGQQDGINKMSVKEYLDNRESYNAIGRKGTGAAQDKARKDFKEKLIKEYTEKLVNEGEYLGEEALEKAKELALSDMKTLNALHNPDMIAGGKDIVFDLGDASVNQSIGSQWKNKGVNELGEKMPLTRVELMDIEAQKALDEFGPDTLMDVDLHRCK